MKNLSYRLFFKAFLKIIKVLEKGPKSVSEIIKETNFEQSRVSHNLKCLKNCGFVLSKRNGRKVIYYLNEETILPIIKSIENYLEKYSTYLEKCGILGK